MSIQSVKGVPGSLPQPAVQGSDNPSPAPASIAASLPAPPAQQTAAPEPQQVQKAIEQIKTALPPRANALQFSLDDTTGKTIVRITDGETGELIRQIPSEELLDIARALDKMQGLLLKESA